VSDYDLRRAFATIIRSMLYKFLNSITRRKLILFLAALIFTRFYNLDQTARFTEDESSDLIRMQQLFQARKITLVGPISNANNKVFGSLTYYMLLPFTVLTGFDPIGPVIGTAFFGVATALLLLVLTWLINRKLLGMMAVLVLIWYPLLETSRWAWNPHLVLFWISLGLCCYLIKKPWAFFLSGICLSLAFHNYYLTLFATAVWAFLVLIREVRNKRYSLPAALSIGYVLPLIPFLLFDLRHPPGLFVTRIFIRNDIPDVHMPTFPIFLEKFWGNLTLVLQYIATTPFVWLIAALILALVILDRKSPRRLMWFLPVILQLVLATIIDGVYTRYFLPALPFLVVWLLMPRQKLGKFLARLIIGVAILSSLLTFKTQLTVTKLQPSIATVRAASNIIIDQIKTNQLKSVNVAALASPDTEPLSVKYRNILLMQDVHLKAASEYDATENLFVISTSSAEAIRAEKSAPIVYFLKSDQIQTFTIPNSDWVVYWWHF